ncbi:MAG: GntR family transcriptional regulator [Planctomycetota bacterium]|jgi:DNA-binding LacI/PurR family transcriptional regulator
MPVTKPAGATLAAKVAERIRGEFLETDARPVKFLPSERELASRMECARTTVRGALGLLAEEGLVRAEQGRGYRVLPRVVGVRAGSAIAVALPEDWKDEGGTSLRSEAAVALQRALVDGGYRALIMRVDWSSPQRAARQLEEANIWGAALVGGESLAYKAVSRLGLPCVAIDCLDRDVPLDMIMQDNFGGGRQAAEHLLDAGHENIAWFGPVKESSHSLERFAGARTAFTARGRDISRKYLFDRGPWEAAAAKRMLGRSDRPTAVLCMWVGATLAVGRAARDLGMKLGEDLHIVGWCTEAKYSSVIEREFGPGKAPPVIVWSTAELATIALARLLWHLREPRIKPLRVSVPTRLVPSAEHL